MDPDRSSLAVLYSVVAVTMTGVLQMSLSYEKLKSVSCISCFRRRIYLMQSVLRNLYARALKVGACN